MKKWNWYNKLCSFFNRNEAIITVVSFVLLFPLVAVFAYLSLVTPLALYEMGYAQHVEHDIFNNLCIVGTTAMLASYGIIYWLTEIILDVASAVNALVHGKKSRKEVKENDI